MKKECLKHPDNIYAEQLFDLENSSYWWQDFSEIIESAKNYTDKKSISSSLFIASLLLEERLEQNPQDFYIVKTYKDTITPIWQREIFKEKHPYLASALNDYLILNQDTSSKELVIKCGLLTLKSLPTYSDIKTIYPDRGIESGLDAIKKFNGNWFIYINELYNFANMAKVSKSIIQTCRDNHWTDEAMLWEIVEEYFDNMILGINLTKIDPHLIESLRKNLDLLSNKELVDKSRQKLSIWKRAKRHANQIISNNPNKQDLNTIQVIPSRYKQ